MNFNATKKKRRENASVIITIEGPKKLVDAKKKERNRKVGGE